MTDLMKDINEFHIYFGIHYQGPPRELPKDIRMFRTGFMREELAEYEYACHANDLEGQLDALVDLVYVALGSAHLHGFDFNEAWARVHDANMKKVKATKASDSKRGYVHDVVKPPGWVPPNLADLVRK
jgi:predicted HAD superfamily Cof-like phosphohydrolase